MCVIVEVTANNNTVPDPQQYPLSTCSRRQQHHIPLKATHHIQAVRVLQCGTCVVRIACAIHARACKPLRRTLAHTCLHASTSLSTFQAQHTSAKRCPLARPPCGTHLLPPDLPFLPYTPPAKHAAAKQVPPGMPFLQHAPQSKHMYESTLTGTHTGSILMNLGVQTCSVHLLARAAEHLPPDLAHMHALHHCLHAENT